MLHEWSNQINKATFCWCEMKVKPLQWKFCRSDHVQLSLVSASITAHAIGYIPTLPSIPTEAIKFPWHGPLR